MMFWYGLIFPGGAVAQTDAPDTDEAATDEAAIHAELRTLRDALTKAVTAGDVDQQLAYAHKTIVTTWQDSRVARGHDGLRDFLKEIKGTTDGVFQGYKVPPTPDELTILHGGDTGIAVGKSVPHYKYLGMEFDLENRWTATLVKDDGQWKIAAYHVSSNIADNPILTLAKKSTYC